MLILATLVNLDLCYDFGGRNWNIVCTQIHYSDENIRWRWGGHQTLAYLMVKHVLQLESVFLNFSIMSLTVAKTN